MPQPVAETDELDDGTDPESVGLAAGDADRQLDVLGCRQGRKQVERLEDEADLIAAQEGQLLVVERREVGVADVHLS